MNYFLGILFAISTTALVLAILAFTNKKGEGYRKNLTSPGATRSAGTGSPYTYAVGSASNITTAALKLRAAIAENVAPYGAPDLVGGMSCSKDTAAVGFTCIQAYNST